MTTVASTTLRFALPSRGLSLAWADKAPTAQSDTVGGGLFTTKLLTTWTYYLKITNIALVPQKLLLQWSFRGQTHSTNVEVAAGSADAGASETVGIPVQTAGYGSFGALKVWCDVGEVSIANITYTIGSITSPSSPIEIGSGGATNISLPSTPAVPVNTTNVSVPLSASSTREVDSRGSSLPEIVLQEYSRKEVQVGLKDADGSDSGVSAAVLVEATMVSADHKYVFTLQFNPPASSGVTA